MADGGLDIIGMGTGVDIWSLEEESLFPLRDFLRDFIVA